MNSVNAANPIRGVFWWAGQENQEFTGELDVSKTGSRILTLFGSEAFATARTVFASAVARPYPRLLGTSLRGQPLTLERCRSTMSGIQRYSSNLDDVFDSSYWTQQFEAEFVCIGHHYRRGDEILFSSIEFSVPGLHEWLCESRGLTSAWSGDRPSAVIYEAFDDTVIALSDDLTVVMGDTYYSKRVLPLKTEIDHGAVVSLRSPNDPKPLEEWLYHASGVVALFSFLMERPIPLEPITGLVRGHPIKVHHGWWHHPGKPSDQRQGGYFDFVRYDDVRDSFAQIARGWMSLYSTHGHVVRDYLYAATGLTRFATDHLLTFVRVAEHIHKRDFERCECRPPERRGERWFLRERLLCLSDCFAHLLGERDARESMVKRIKDTRNSLVHLGDMATVLAHIDRLVVPYEGIRSLVTLHVLRQLGIDEDTSEVILRRKLPNALHHWSGGR